jgi:hypothetical protein
MSDYAALAAKFNGSTDSGAGDYGALAARMGGAIDSAQPAEPLKIGAEGFGDALRGELKNAGWAARNYAGAGTALSDLYQGAKQFFGAGDKQQIEAQKIIAQEAPVGALAGNIALTAVPLAKAGYGFKAAAGTGAAIGALAPVAGDQSFGHVATEKLKDAAIGAAGGLVGQAAANKISQYVAGQAAKQASLQSRNSEIDKTIADGIAAGLKIPPSSVNPTIRNLALESVAGKDATKQIMSNENAEVFDSLARKATGLAPDAPLNEKAMQDVRAMAYKTGYEPVASVGAVPTDQTYQNTINAIANKYAGVARSFPGAVPDEMSRMAGVFKVNQFNSKDGLEAIQYLRDEATKAFKAGDTGMTKAMREVSKAIEDQLERHLAQGVGGAQTMHAVTMPNGQTVYLSAQDMLKNFRDARKLMAQSHTVEDAIVTGGGYINAKSVGKDLQNGAPLSDELSVIGRFANNFDKASQPAKQVAGPGVSKLGYYGATGVGTMLGTAFGPLGAVAGGAGVMAVPYAVRAALGSKPVQRSLIRDYGPSATTRAVSAFGDRATLATPLTLSELARMRQQQPDQNGAPMRDLAAIRR